MPDRLAASAAFTELAPHHLEALASCATPVAFPRGGTLFREGEPADRFFLLRDGRVALVVHDAARGPLTVETLEPGEVVGWSWLFDPYRWHFDGVAVEDVDAIAFDAPRVRALCDADHELGYLLMRRFAGVIVDRLQHTRIRLLDVYGIRDRD